MNKVTDISEPASELERLIADLSGSGRLVFVFGDGFTAAHLKGVTTPLFRGPADRRWWHVDLGDDAASWTMDVRVDEITGVRAITPVPQGPSRSLAVHRVPKSGRSEAWIGRIPKLIVRVRFPSPAPA